MSDRPVDHLPHITMIGLDRIASKRLTANHLLSIISFLRFVPVVVNQLELFGSNILCITWFCSPSVRLREEEMVGFFFSTRREGRKEGSQSLTHFIHRFSMSVISLLYLYVMQFVFQPSCLDLMSGSLFTCWRFRVGKEGISISIGVSFFISYCVS